jgi:hypothetical protein
MEKVVTIYLDNSAYDRGNLLVSSFADKHGANAGAFGRIPGAGGKYYSLGGASDAVYARGWLTTMLEKS